MIPRTHGNSHFGFCDQSEHWINSAVLFLFTKQNKNGGAEFSYLMSQLSTRADVWALFLRAEWRHPKEQLIYWMYPFLLFISYYQTESVGFLKILSQIQIVPQMFSGTVLRCFLICTSGAIPNLIFQQCGRLSNNVIFSLFPGSLL